MESKNLIQYSVIKLIGNKQLSKNPIIGMQGKNLRQIAEQLCVKFLFQLPDSELDVTRLSYHIQLAFYYYIDRVLRKPFVKNNKYLRELYEISYEIMKILSQFQGFMKKIKLTSGIQEDIEILGEDIYKIIRLKERSVYGAISYKRFQNQYDKNKYDIKVLMVQCASTDKLGFPKGKINQGQQPHQCARRQVLEQTKLNLTSLSQQSIKFKADEKKTRQCQHCFCSIKRAKNFMISYPLRCQQVFRSALFFLAEVSNQEYDEYLENKDKKKYQQQDPQSMQIYKKQIKNTEICSVGWYNLANIEELDLNVLSRIVIPEVKLHLQKIQQNINKDTNPQLDLQQVKESLSQQTRNCTVSLQEHEYNKSIVPNEGSRKNGDKNREIKRKIRYVQKQKKQTIVKAQMNYDDYYNEDQRKQKRPKIQQIKKPITARKIATKTTATVTTTTKKKPIYVQKQEQKSQKQLKKSVQKKETKKKVIRYKEKISDN